MMRWLRRRVDTEALVPVLAWLVALAMVATPILLMVVIVKLGKLDDPWVVEITAAGQPALIESAWPAWDEDAPAAFRQQMMTTLCDARQ